MYTGKSTCLRELRTKDLQDIMEYVNDYDLYSSFTDSAPFPKTEDFQKKWMEGANSDKIRTFAIETLEDHVFIGTCQLRNIDMLNRKAMLSIIIGKSTSHGKGYGYDALRSLLRFGFEELNLNRICLTVYSDNHGAIRLYEKSGFVSEGVLKKEIYRKGDYSDQLVYSLLKREYLDIKDKEEADR